MLDANHASGVEAASAAVRHARDDAFDFLITSMGSASLTLAGTHDCRYYRPLFPIHYTKQVCLCRPSLIRRPSQTKQLFVYAASSGLEEALVRRRELALKEIVERDFFTTLIELIPELDNGQAVNIWDPLATCLERRFGWSRTVAAPYLTQICLYQHVELDRKASADAADAFKTLFLSYWTRLARNRYEALGYLFDCQPMKHQFAIGSGMTFPSNTS